MYTRLYGLADNNNLLSSLVVRGETIDSQHPEAKVISNETPTCEKPFPLPPNSVN